METGTILYVADSPRTAATVAPLLAAAGYRLMFVSNPSEAVALVFLHRDLRMVVLDQQTQLHSNFDLARTLKSLRDDVPVLVVSSEQLESLPYGMDSYVATEDGLQALPPTLQKLLGSKQQAAR